ncbi:MAG: glutamine amidotransferase family protein [Thermodesulfobacteriaceae bacterium]|nr:glutamine amidotransferase family protein [Thermodesulfobacteriaceae bacterium]MCX8040866.1 glutamine amidotransferase family protein [Thermodesulfobacteriaceae bacterium]MDW8136268.1 glutamine amidotransferase family protein [Thermodesulfobacterium sp.]
MWNRTLISKEISGCGISGIIHKKGKLISGEVIIKSICCQEERGNGLGAGFAAYGIYPGMENFYTLHVMAENSYALELVEELLAHQTFLNYQEPIPTRKVKTIKNPPLFKRYFVRPKFEGELTEICDELAEDNYIVKLVMEINTKIEGAYVISSGKNMGVFKGVGFPDEIAEFFRIEEYKAFIWTGHNRFPTNTPGWWGGAHPFTILDWSIVHNGEISSYGTNKRYLELFGYKCTLLTDTEVVAYILDLLIRRHGLPLKVACLALAPPFWMEIDEMSEERELLTAIRIIYGSAMLNGPFAILFAYNGGLVGLNDRVKLRPLVAAEKGDLVYMASEEAAIRAICPDPDKVWAPKAGEPVIVELEPNTIPNQRSYLKGRPREEDENELRVKCAYTPLFASK